MLLDSNSHLLSAKTLDFPLGYQGIEINFVHISNCTTIESELFYEESRRLSKRSLNIHMSRVNFDKKYNKMIFELLFVLTYITSQLMSHVT